MDEYRYPLFFAANMVTSKEKEKIRRYFQIKRESGGGDCGVIESVGDNVYQICFREKEDQERVLERKEHDVPLPRRNLHLTVMKSFHNPEPNTQFSKTNTKRLEKIIKIDIYLLYYLRDNPKAYKVLQKQLSAIGYTVELNFDKEEAVVREDIEKGPGRGFGAAEKWEIQVDRVFIDLTDSYICHHVTDPKQIRILMQDPSFVTDDIRVYTELGYSVVVGEFCAVNERVNSLEKSVLIRKKLPVLEKQVKLIEEEFTREMRATCPEVKVLIGDAMVILEGPEKEVQLGTTKLDELMKSVKERRVNLPTELITFIKTSGVMSKYQDRFQQSLRNPVSLEVGSDLVLSSLSSGALDEAEAAVKRDLSVDTVQLQGAAAVPPDLDRVKEILNKAKNEVNFRQFRVDFSFISAVSGTALTKVRLVGYSENVNKLKEILHDYQMNHVGTQEVLNLPHSELVDCFDKFSDLTGIKQTEVTLKASHFPYPCVLVSGPRCLVQEVQASLNAKLANLTSDTLVLDGPGAQWYFEGKGQRDKELVQSSCQVLIKEQQQKQSMATTSDLSTMLQYISMSRFRTPSRSTTISQCNTTSSTASTTLSVNKTNLVIKVGSLVDEQVNVLVAPMVNRKLTSTKIGKSLLQRAGNTMQRHFDLMAGNGTHCAGDVMQVDAPPSVGCSKILFIECLPWDGNKGKSVQALGNGLKKCLDLCVQQGWSSVAFPVIGPGIILKYPLREAVQVLTDKIHQFGLSASSGSLSTIHVVIKPDYPDSEECYHDIYRHLSLNMNQGGRAIFRSLTSDLDEITIRLEGDVKLQLVFGDITNETTEAIVNTTDFNDFETDGVCKGILTVAGPHIKAELRKAKTNRGDVFKTQPGSFPCKAILHVCGEKDAGVIEQLVCRIIQQCESCQYNSVAIPAICAGAGGLDAGVVAQAILQGVNSTKSSSKLQHLTNIRIVLIKIDIFLAFKKQALQMFPHAVINTVSQLADAPQHPPPLDINIDFSILSTSSTLPQSVFLIIGLCRKDVDDAMTKLKNLYQAQCSKLTFKKEDLAGFTQDYINNLKQIVDILGLCLEEDQSGQGIWTVSGLKDRVDQMMQMIHNLAL
ncbi:uncharacterized protein LOC113157845 isoform X2 [Anabas testudineus]|uniref:uncharacterized protein LOC113157845 isoform X2 n=1 Tax=Anabas testudineus TaxID=64144 RepID=UPI000E456812|nr:uncharacterized protein LOC113157845 isoform X2 [Anabas testudineus]